MNRPVVTICQEFAAIELGNKIFLGDYTWAVTASPASLLIVQDKLTQYEAEQFALALNKTAEGFRGVLGMSIKRAEQVLIDFEVRAGLAKQELEPRNTRNTRKKATTNGH